MTLKVVEDLEKALANLPGMGRRSASRAALALVRDQDKLILPLLAALNAARAEVVTCSKCGSFTVRSENPCACCSDDTRETTILCVVEEPADIVQIESSGAFKGKYHCLGGKLALSRRSGPEKLRFAALVERVEKEGVREVLLALSTDMEGDATASYAAEILKPSGVKVTRLAFGLPADSGIAYSDPLTLRRAITGRLDV